ncbi:RHS repeat-associated core domain-containing protein [Singulisphaera rosea]
MPSGGTNLATYTLSYAPLESSTFTTIATGTAPLSDGSLGTFDPTMLPDGPYTLKLTSTDTSSQTTTVSRTINVQGKLKLGNFSLSFNDLNLPSPGLPITITRSYDTLDASRTADFGYGWRFDELDSNLKVSISQTGSEGQGIFAGFTAGTHITLTRPGAAPEGFTFAPTPDTNLALYVGASEEYFPNFIPDPGVTDTLTVPQIALIALGDGTYIATSDANLDPYNPADSVFGSGAYTLTTVSGLTYSINAANGRFISETDRVGNTLNFSNSGIISSGPQGQIYRQVTFTPNGSGRIGTITDPNGKSITYTYSTAGDLSTVTDRLSNVTQFFYAMGHPHDIDHVIDPLGRKVAQVSYGTDGRVTVITDALGNTTTNSNSITSLSATETPPGGGGSSSVSYDNQGNPIGVTDTAGNSSQATYVNNLLASQTQVVNGVAISSTYTYYPNGSIATVTDPLSHVTQFTDNDFGQPETVTDPQGNTTTIDYYPNGLIQSATSPKGVTTSCAYDTSGNLKSQTTPNGTTTYTYDAQGNLATTTDPRGVTTVYTYDGNGNQKTSQWTWVDPNNAAHTQVVNTVFTYDFNDRLTQTEQSVTDSVAGLIFHTITQGFYDLDGRVYKTIDELGGVALTTYDSNGRVIQTTSPDNKITDTVYDAQGRVLWTDDPHLPGQPTNATKTLYDAAGNASGTERHAGVVIAINNPTTNPTSSLTSVGTLLSSTTTTYDAAGRVTQTKDAATHVVTYKYDAAGHQIEVDDVAAGVSRATKSSYDAAGRLIASTDALGYVTHYSYDNDGNLFQTTYPDKTTTTTTYDANGRKATSVDQNGLETDYHYNSFGDLTSVVLPAVIDPATGLSTKPTYTYGYDSYGNLVSVTDPLNHTTTYKYDALGNKISETLPMSQSETWAYNSLGQLASTVDFDGQTIAYQYDTLGRVQQKTEYPQGVTTASTTVTYTYDTADSNGDGGHYDTVVSTAAGTTTSYFDVNGNLVKLTSPQGTINYTYNLATGLKTAVTTTNTDTQYGYDDLGRLKTVTVDKLDGISLGSPLATTYTYDLNNNLITTNLPNGTTETRQYDPLNRLSFLKTTDPSAVVISSYRYSLDLNGNRRVVVENTGRRDDYTYDADGRLVQEAITQDPAAARDRTFTYTYDLAGNRVASTDSGAPASQQSLTYTYDANDRLLTVTGTSGYSQTYTYDANGSTKTVTGTSGAASSTSTWDLEGHLASYASGGVTTSYTYDDAGNRTTETTAGSTMTFLNDPNQAYDQVLEEYTAGGVLAATYIRGLDLLFQDRTTAGGGTGKSFYVVDGLGSTRALTNSSGTVTDTYTYEVYGDLIGQTWAATAATPNEFLYAGYQFDVAIGQAYLRARYYDEAIGEFGSRDTSDGLVFDPITQNHYIYSDSDPVNRVDPSGHDGDFVSLQVGMGESTAIAGQQAPAAFQSFTAIAGLETQVAYRAIQIAANAENILFYSEFGLLATLFGLEVSSELLRYSERGITALLNNTDPIPGGPDTKNIGEFMERKFQANGTEYETIDAVVDEPGGQRGIISLGSKYGADSVSDDRYIQRVLGEAENKARKISTGRVFVPRPGFSAEPIEPQNVGGRLTVIGIPETRARILTNPAFIRGLMNLRATIRNVRFAVVPIRGWRPR